MTEINENCLDEVDAFIFHTPTENRRKEYPTRNKEQPWIIYSTETEDNYPQLKDPNYMNKFDIKATYHLNSDIPISYFISLEFYTRFWNMETKNENALIAVLVSNCNPINYRNELISELSLYIPLHSYGKCFHNIETPPEMNELSPWEARWHITSKYKFTLAIENSNEDDYVTEKLFYSFLVGSVPIYQGASNVDFFAPSNRSIIKVTDFKNVKELADYLLYLHNNPTQYGIFYFILFLFLFFFHKDKYLEWKIKGPSEHFKQLSKTSPRTVPCRMCERVANYKNNIKI